MATPVNTGHSGPGFSDAWTSASSSIAGDAADPSHPASHGTSDTTTTTAPSGVVRSTEAANAQPAATEPQPDANKPRSDDGTCEIRTLGKRLIPTESAGPIFYRTPDLDTSGVSHTHTDTHGFTRDRVCLSRNAIRLPQFACLATVFERKERISERERAIRVELHG